MLLASSKETMDAVAKHPSGHRVAPRPLKAMCALLPPTLYLPMDYSPPGSSIHGIFQARTLKWVAISFSRGSSPPGIELEGLTSPALAGWNFTTSATWEALNVCYLEVEKPRARLSSHSAVVTGCAPGCVL